MAADIPLIDSRTYADLVAEVEALASEYTGGTVAPVTAAALLGKVLGQAITDPAAGGIGGIQVAAGTLLDGTLAARLAAIADLASVSIRGWQPPPTPDLGSALIRIFR